MAYHMVQFCYIANLNQHNSPSRTQSCHKDLVIKQLKDEIRDLQLRESDYHDGINRQRELELKLEVLKDEKVVFIIIESF